MGGLLSKVILLATLISFQSHNVVIILVSWIKQKRKGDC